MSFAHLHVHTEFSLLDGSNKIKEYVSRVKELGMNSAAITDHGVMYGVVDFYREAKKQGINPILGCEVYVAPNSRFDREITGGDDRYYHLVLLAENDEGYANLTKIVSKGFVEGYYYKPRVDKELLRKYHKGIIALSACLAGEVARFLTKGLYEEAKKTALEYQEIFGAYAAFKNTNVLICIGPLSKDMAEAAKETALATEKDMKVFHFDTKEDFYQNMNQILKENDTVLVKASHYMEFPEIVKKLSED